VHAVTRDGTLVIASASGSVLKAFEDGGSSEIVARRLVGSTVVRALNHIGYHELEDLARPAGGPDRRTTGVAGDAPAPAAAIVGLIDRIGYDPVRFNKAARPAQHTSLRLAQIASAAIPRFA
jgi:predicted dinucleotide-binding enzyme